MEDLLITAVIESVLSKETFSGFGTFIILTLMLSKIRKIEKSQNDRFKKITDMIGVCRDNKSICELLEDIDKKIEINSNDLKKIVSCPYLEDGFLDE